MIIKPTVWGWMRGRLSTTPEEAQKLFGFKMKPGAIGVYFRIRNKKIANKGWGSRSRIKRLLRWRSQ